jgi:hypothetical protein
VPTSYWTVVELNCGIVCASLPTLRPLLRRLSGKNTQGSSSDDYQLTAGSKKSANKPPLYSLPTILHADSQEGLKENAQTFYEAPEYAQHTGRTSRISTAISGGNKVPKAGRTGSDTDSSNNGSDQQQITITRETVFRESRKGGDK